MRGSDGGAPRLYIIAVDDGDRPQLPGYEILGRPGASSDQTFFLFRLDCLSIHN